MESADHCMDRSCCYGRLDMRERVDNSSVATAQKNNVPTGCDDGHTLTLGDKVFNEIPIQQHLLINTVILLRVGSLNGPGHPNPGENFGGLRILDEFDPECLQPLLPLDHRVPHVARL